MPIIALLFTLSVAGVKQTPAVGAARAAGHPIRALLVVAHPDDEYEMAATIYRITKERSGVVDQVIITDGEGGYRYSYLASRYYGVNLTNEATGRADLPHIRQEEARGAARILGIRHQWFFNERDDHFTTNLQDALQTWHAQRILGELSEKLQKGRYDVVFVLLPTADTHGEHKAASLLTLRAVDQLPASERPAVVGVEADSAETISYQMLAGYPITATLSSQPQFHFDRDVHFGFRNALTYEIVVDWVIAEHKSQGLFQTKCGQDRFENFWVFSLGGRSSLARASSVFDQISLSQPAGRQRPVVQSAANQRVN